MKITRRKVLQGVGVAFAATGLSQVGAASRLKVTRQTLRLPKWSADGFRVAVISDLHVNTEADAALTRRAFALAYEAKPDLIAIPGDFYDEHRHDHIPMLDAALTPVREQSVPVVATLGNHDYWSAPSRVIETVRQAGIRLLRNESMRVDEVLIHGIDDGIANRDRHDALGQDGDAGSVLALFHEPDFCTRVDKRVSLMLAGHSHGGQVCLPFGLPLHMPRGARTYVSGFYPDASVPLYVTDGIGTVGPSVRTFCRPEVSVLDLFRA